MRCYMTSFAILLAIFAFSPMQTMAKGPDGGHGGGKVHGGEVGGSPSSGVHIESGKQGGEHHGNVGVDAGVNRGTRSNAEAFKGQGTKQRQVYDARNRPEYSGGRGEGRDGWRYRWDNGHWWFYGPDNRWMWYGDDGRWLNYDNAYVVRRPILENFSGGPIKIVNPAKSGVTLSYTLNGNAYTIPPGYSQELQEDRAWVIEFSRGENLDQARYGLQSGVYTFTRTNQGMELYRSEFPQTSAPTVAPQPPKAAPTNPSQQ